MLHTHEGISRRRLLAGLGLAAGAALTEASVLPRSQLPGWDARTGVLVVGAGAAGVCAAIEAARAGAEVLIVESMPRPGGSSAMSAGVVYAGGGTALQRALGVQDGVEDMYRFLASAGPHAPLDKIQVYCEESAAHFDWLRAQGIPYRERLSRARGAPATDESLYYSGNELAWPAREVARPAPRGHLPGLAGTAGGRRMMEILLARAGALGVRLRTGVAARQLVVESDGRVAGLIVDAAGQRQAIGAARAVVLACGGFVYDRQMLRRHAPALYECSAAWAGAGDLGDGIKLAVAAGAATVHMEHGCAEAPLAGLDSVLAGILVNAAGQRFIAEDSSPLMVADAIVRLQGGRAWLIADQRSAPATRQDRFLAAARGNTLGDVAVQLDLPRGALQHSIAYYNRHAANGEDPLWRKSPALVRPLQGPPYTAWNLSVADSFFPVYTLGGLQTTVGGAVLNGFGEVIGGLYAVGRTAAGLPVAPCIAQGLSLGDCTFFGRRAGAAAARGEGLA